LYKFIFIALSLHLNDIVSEATIRRKSYRLRKKNFGANIMQLDKSTDFSKETQNKPLPLQVEG